MSNKLVIARHNSLGRKLLAEVERLRNEKTNHGGYKTWRAFSDEEAVRRVALYCAGLPVC